MAPGDASENIQGEGAEAAAAAVNVGGAEAEVAANKKGPGGNPKTATLSIKLPEDGELKSRLLAADLDKSGDISLVELRALIETAEKGKEQSRQQRMIIIGLLAIVLLLCGVMFASSVLAGTLLKELRVSNAQLLATDGTPVKTASSDFHVGADNCLVSANETDEGAKNNQPLVTGSMLVKHPLSSRQSDEQLMELHAFKLPLLDGGSRFIRVNSWSRHAMPDAQHCGSVLVLDTSSGEFLLDGEDLYYDGVDPDIIATYGYWSDEESNRRLSSAAANGHIRGRRLATGQVGGMYSSIRTSAQDFECNFTSDDGSVTVITPPSMPKIPFSFITEMEHPCKLGDGIDVCTSRIPGTAGILRPGVVVQQDDTLTMRSFEAVLQLTEQLRILIEYFPSHIMQRKVTITDSESNLSVSYHLIGEKDFEDLPLNSSNKMHCKLSSSNVKSYTPKQADLAYLGSLLENGNKYSRWQVGSDNSLVELWQDESFDAPYRVFMPGGVSLTNDAHVALEFSPLKYVEFKQDLDTKATEEWLGSFLGEAITSSTVVETVKGLVTCQGYSVTGNVLGRKVKIPNPSGVYGEDTAWWYGDVLAEAGWQQAREMLALPDTLGVVSWPHSHEVYWMKLMDERQKLFRSKQLSQVQSQAAGTALMTHSLLKEYLTNMTSPGNASDPSRRLQTDFMATCERLGASTARKDSVHGRVENMQEVMHVLLDVVGRTRAIQIWEYLMANVPQQSPSWQNVWDAIKKFAGEQYVKDAAYRLSQLAVACLWHKGFELKLPKGVATALLGKGGYMRFAKDGYCWSFRAGMGAKPWWQKISGITMTLAGSLEYCTDTTQWKGKFMFQLGRGFCQNTKLAPSADYVSALFAGNIMLKGESPVMDQSSCSVQRHGLLKTSTGLIAEAGAYKDSGGWLRQLPATCELCNLADWKMKTRREKKACKAQRRDPDDYESTPMPFIGGQALLDVGLRFDQFTPGYGVDVSANINLQINVNLGGIFELKADVLEDYELFTSTNAFTMPASTCSRRLQENVEQRWLCEDTCSHAHDGHCDDGGEDSRFHLCHLGTDCADCGTRSVEF